MAFTLWAVFTITFFLMRAVPGGPFSGERQLKPEIERNINERYNLNDPLYKQYLKGLWGVVRLDLGPSMRLLDYSANDIIREGFPISASLGILALFFAILLGVTAGVIAALFRQSWLDVSFMTVATVGIALPNFWLASIGIVLFVFVLGWFPAAGWGTLSQIVQPALWLGLPFAAYIARLTRTGMLDVLHQDYIRTAYAKGLAPTRVVMRHALKGGIVPVVSYLGPATAGILTGSIVLEKIFALPGMGIHFIHAAEQRDFPLAMGIVLVYTTILLVMNTLVDISYSLLDPRVKLDA
jgi:oligopeptide transport system permease protein